MSEEWRAVAGYEGLYEVSSTGKVRSLPRYTTKGCVLAPHLTHDGYPRLMLSQCNKRRMVCIHTLVARAFLGERPLGHVINHKDAVKTNNIVDNLEYTTKRGNYDHAILHGLLVRGSAHPLSRLTEGDVRVIKDALATGGKRGFQSRLAEHYGVSSSAVTSIKRGKLWGWM